MVAAAQRRAPCSGVMSSSTANNCIRYHEYPLEGIEPMTADTDRRFPRHTHDQYGIGVVDSGGHSSWSDRGQIEAGPGTFICVNPGEVHDGRPIGHWRRSWRILYFEPAVLAKACEDVYEGSKIEFVFASPAFHDARLRQLFDAAFAYADALTNTSTAWETLACESAILCFVAGLGRHTTSPSGSRTVPAARIEHTRQRIDDDPAAPLTLAQLAGEAGLSRYQLLRGFARHLGLTPLAYIRQRRLEYARRLIRAGHPLCEVAVLAGFCDQSHLHRHFLEKYGVTPSRYARRL